MYCVLYTTNMSGNHNLFFNNFFFIQQFMFTNVGEITQTGIPSTPSLYLPKHVAKYIEELTGSQLGLPLLDYN